MNSFIINQIKHFSEIALIFIITLIIFCFCIISIIYFMDILGSFIVWSLLKLPKYKNIKNSYSNLSKYTEQLKESNKKLLDQNSQLKELLKRNAPVKLRMETIKDDDNNRNK